MTLAFNQYVRGHLRHYLSWGGLLSFPFLIVQSPKIDGILVIAAGAALRAYASGFLDKEGRLTIGGPFAYVRNPLYVGTILMACGVAQSQRAWVAFGVILATAIGLMYLIARAEEQVLAQKFPETYPIYMREVPRFLPRIWPSKSIDTLRASNETRSASFSMALYRKNRGFEALLTGVALVALMFGVHLARRHFFQN